MPFRRLAFYLLSFIPRGPKRFYGGLTPPSPLTIFKVGVFFLESIRLFVKTGNDRSSMPASALFDSRGTLEANNRRDNR